MLDNGLGMLRSLSTCTRLFSFFKFLLVEFEIVVLEIPLTEGVGINTYDGVLNEGLGTDEFIVCSVVNDIDNTGLTGDCLRSPRECASINSECTMFLVATAATNLCDFSRTEFGHSWNSAHFELSLLLVNWHATTRCSSLVSRVPRNTHNS